MQRKHNVSEWVRKLSVHVSLVPASAGHLKNAEAPAGLVLSG